MSDEKPRNYDLSEEPKRRFLFPDESQQEDRTVYAMLPPEIPDELYACLNPGVPKPQNTAARQTIKFPSISIIIPTRPGDAEPLALAAARVLKWPRSLLEIIVVRGTQPSVQRNTALRAAKGEWIYFLDDDSLPHPDNLQRAHTYCSFEKVVMVGGSNVCPAGAPPLEQSFATVMGTWLAFGPSRARYTPVGKARASGEKELILCNLMGRREALLAAGGFDEALYPNEENALMDELQRRGGTLLYDPEFIVHRRPRRTLGAFCKMLMNYGRGRAEQFRLHPTLGSAPNFVPPLFLLYLVLTPLLPTLLLWPLVLYAVAVLAQTLASSSHCLFNAARVAPLIVVSHVCYGLGFWRGLFTRPQPKPPEQVPVTLETILPS
jgi:succinoglycan biosynthesis protein ExoA